MGLPGTSIASLQAKYGRNEFAHRRYWHSTTLIWNTVKDPMVILLIVSGVLYFLLGERAEGMMMLAALLLVLGISFYQEVRSSNAINHLKQLITPNVVVIRDGVRVTVHSRDLVPGDVIWLEEGQKIPADAVIIDSHDLSVNEAILTGESVPLIKTAGDESRAIFQGTLISSGSCFARVTATGNQTRLAAIGRLADDPSSQKTLLQLQTTKIVKRLALLGLTSFVLILGINYLHYRDIVISLLFALTLAMSVIPEEIPVAFSSFMALGAYKLSRLGVFVRQPQIIENLGCMDVICLDKTGTITENKMVVHTVYNYHNDELTPQLEHAANLLYYGTLASEYSPFDSMEKAITEAYISLSAEFNRPRIVYEYPISGTPPMMTHVYNDGSHIFAAAKGAPERIMRVCKLDQAIRSKLQVHLDQMTGKGLRVLGVASARLTGEVPAEQDDFNWQFEGFIALFDPPKKNIPEVIRQFYAAGLEVKLVTGDYPETAISIGEQAGIHHRATSYTGEQVMRMTDDQLNEAAKSGNIFSRMFPEAKLRLIRQLGTAGHTVGMTGDGVNDAPALKASAIGIAMGKRGTEMAQQSADLVIADDDLSKISLTINEGRRIFHNLRKSVRYIISIHIPILLVATIPVLLSWKFPNIFTPVHIIFLELIMGPTCSIFFEREPVESAAISAGPRKRDTGLLQRDDTLISVIQGIVIGAACLLLYYLFMRGGASLEKTRTIVFTTLILCNILLTFSARSTFETIRKTIHYKNPLVWPVISMSIIFLGLILFLPAARSLFGLTSLSLALLTVCMLTAVVSVLWFEIYKTNLPENTEEIIRRRKRGDTSNI